MQIFARCLSHPWNVRLPKVRCDDVLARIQFMDLMLNGYSSAPV